MNYRLENRISMYYKVREFFNNNLPTLTPTVPALTAQVNDFNTKLTALDALIITADENTGGYTLQKQSNRSTMRNLALSISGALYAHAKITNNEALASKIYTTKSTLDQKRDTDILYWCERLNNLASANAPALVPLGITAATLASYTTSIVNYRAVIQDPADRRSEGAAAFVAADKQVELIDSNLKITDAIMLAASMSHAQLYNQYLADRRIDDNSASNNGGGGNNNPPDVTEVIEANGTEGIFSIPYLSSRVFQLRNNSNLAIEWGLSEDENQPTHPLISLDPNATVQRISGALAPSGDWVIVRNANPQDITVELTVIEE